MKIKRFLAKDMRTALAQVKETLGSEAVIMSNKKVTGGIEIVAAVDYDEPKPNLQKVLNKPTAPTFMELAEEKISLGFKRPVRSETKVNPAPAADSLQALLERQQSRVNQQATSKSDELEMPDWAKGLQAPQMKQAAPEIKPSQYGQRSNSNGKNNTNHEMDAMREELASLRNLLTHQVTSLLSEQKSRVNPVGAMLESKLLDAEFSPIVATKLSDLSEHYQPAELVRALPRCLANMLDNQGDDIVRQGGVVAFVGPTGVGKTTTVAKLAARFAAHHGADQVALITTDHYRIGAFEQLATYGKIMGCPVKQAHDLNELEQILYQFRNRKLVLIDTAGMGQRDVRLFQQLDNLAANSRLPIRSYLVLSATGQRRVLEDAVAQFKRIPLSGAVLTKLDESVSLAPALSVLIQSGLPLSYVTDGQRVPEDMQVADTFALANKALSVLNRKEQVITQNCERSDEKAYAFE
ncbi:flagellar biosynthesis protein FlhF [Shewanella sp. D64]|uniref:flagellar biosynthesis protein FlhF n=1 Tax=unclassified Shewanella TaxID=196818 RepID=UPI0022BA4B1E|nr:MULTISPECIES: flagellar biosynthesis protein FlhF [unclassified Shewanella]MEC4726496.1 flagellar biosynthesis protein FlhF [Shewanella sp. D64]MEC4737463.1 flagellar biosynthesis protein FlhF [Shewanella sp. E94]WBJ97276.1 flagellar biosynthesis protein FlhF [Shewanella sp. MTB7]